MDHLNLILFEYLNGPENPGYLELGTARFAAEWLIWLIAFGLALGYFRSSIQGRVAIIRTGLATALALVANITIATLWYHPRPFVLSIGHQLLPHAPDTSFPSDHATVMFAAAFGLLMFATKRIWSSLALTAAIAVAWARVWLGVHWPLDMAGSVGVAALALVAVRGLATTAAIQRITAALLGLTDTVLGILRIPADIAPRTSARAPSTSETNVNGKAGH